MSVENGSNDSSNVTEESEQFETKRGGFKLAIPRRRRGSVRLFDLMNSQRDVYDQIMRFVAAGAFGWVSAQAAGVSVVTFNKWLARGRLDAERNRGSIYREFYTDLMRAQATARLQVELKVKNEDPKFWLTHGPGKTRRGEPGWTETLAMGGAEELDPISLSIDSHNTSDSEPPVEVNTQELAQALDILAQLGIVSLGPAGVSITGAGKVVNGQIVDLEEDEDDEEDETKDGYAPERNIPYKDIPTPKQE